MRPLLFFCPQQFSCSFVKMNGTRRHITTEGTFTDTYSISFSLSVCLSDHPRWHEIVLFPLQSIAFYDFDHSSSVSSELVSFVTSPSEIRHTLPPLWYPYLRDGQVFQNLPSASCSYTHFPPMIRPFVCIGHRDDSRSKHFVTVICW